LANPGCGNLQRGGGYEESMHVVRRLSLLLTAFTLGIAVLLGALNSRPTVSANAARLLAASTHYFDSTVVLARGSRPRGVLGDQLAISLGYLERLRLGLGSPFRLVDEALVDPRLDHQRRARVAWALLGRLRRGDSYFIDPSVLDGFGPWSADGHGATGAAHVALIERAIRSASDPRAGELAVRLAYPIAAASGAISGSATGIATEVAALLRDRALAEGDVRDVLSDANEMRRSVLDLISERRAMHSLRVEQPSLAPLSSDLQIEAMEAVPSLVAAIDTLDRVRATPTAGPHASLLNSYFASELDNLGALQPSLAQVGVTLGTRMHSDIRATNEETLVAGYARSLSENDSMRRANTLAILASAVALRTVAQSEPWFPGDGGPDAGDLNAEFGLADVTFTRGVPRAWRPYYMRELQLALRDLQRVLPGFSPNGLHVRFSNEVLRDSALAMHEPRTRTLQLSISTSAGTLAHELSHDLDWQAARRLYSDGTGYSTDRAMQEHSGPLAASVKGLAAARLVRSSGGGEASTAASARPAELFARGSDWFIATVLAQQGRSNGFLSAAEDGLLTGYAAGVPAALGSAGTESLLSAISEMTYLPDSIRDGFEAQWSEPQNVDPSLLVRRVMETPLQLHRGLPPQNFAAGIMATTHVDACVADRSGAIKARQHLMMLAIDARARGIAAHWTRRRSLTGRQDDRDRLREAIRSALVAELGSALSNQGFVPLVPGIFRSGAAICSNIAP
jgi:hypothetical protein